MHFEQEAGNWVRWARTPGHDAYWWWSPAFFEAIVPAAGERTLELGCGEGRVARDLDQRGDRVVACDISPVLINSLMDVDKMATAVHETSRVLARDGRFCICVTHPVSDAGAFTTEEPDAPFVISGSYFGRRPFTETVSRDGLEMTFKGWCVPLEEYARALEDAGFLIERLREPQPSGAVADHDRRWERVPMFLHIVAVKT